MLPRNIELLHSNLDPHKVLKMDEAVLRNGSQDIRSKWSFKALEVGMLCTSPSRYLVILNSSMLQAIENCLAWAMDIILTWPMS